MKFPSPRRPPEATHGVDALIEAVRVEPREITLITLGPLTNIALGPDVCTRRSEHFVGIAIRSELTRGMTVVDQRGVLRREPNGDV